MRIGTGIIAFLLTLAGCADSRQQLVSIGLLPNVDFHRTNPHSVNQARADRPIPTTQTDPSGNLKQMEPILQASAKTIASDTNDSIIDRSQPATPVSPPDVSPPDSTSRRISGTAGTQDSASQTPSAEPSSAIPVELPDGATTEETVALQLGSIIESIHRSYPAVESAYQERTVAIGNQLAASGEFDLKLKASSQNGPTGYYQTYRQNVGIYQPTWNGGEWFAAYRIGRGDYQPWYRERETNGGGEFKAGLSVPLLRNRNLDRRRATLWRADYERLIVEPDIRARLIGFVRDGAGAYWKWVAAGQRYEVLDGVLQKARERNRGIQRQFEEGALGRPAVDDNEQMILLREAKLLDAERKLRQAAIKLSLYWRDNEGNIIVPDPVRLPEFPAYDSFSDQNLDQQIVAALQQRPEIEVLELARRRYELDYAEAHNQLKPELNALLMGSQDVGRPTSKSRDKSEFELEAQLYLDVPVQRRKARGKMRSLEGKIAQLAAKRKLVEDKIVTEVQSAHVAVLAAESRIERTEQAVTRLRKLAAVERRKLETGESDLLKVNLREQYAAEAEIYSIDALEDYFNARADLAAALALDRMPDPQSPEPVPDEPEAAP